MKEAGTGAMSLSGGEGGLKHHDLGQFYDELDERDDLSEMMKSDHSKRNRSGTQALHKMQKQITLENIDERDGDDESLALSQDSMSISGASFNFRLTQTRKNLAEKLNDLPQVPEENEKVVEVVDNVKTQENLMLADNMSPKKPLL